MKPKRGQASAGGILSGVEPALRRGAQRARETAARTRTPLVIYRDGKIEKRMVPRAEKPNGK
jgi:hypothetical protein